MSKVQRRSHWILHARERRPHIQLHPDEVDADSAHCLHISLFFSNTVHYKDGFKHSEFAVTESLEYSSKECSCQGLSIIIVGRDAEVSLDAGLYSISIR